MRYRTLVAGSLLLAVLLRPAHAEDLRLTVHAGFAGLGKAGRWLPVRVVVRNDGPTVSGTLSLLPPSRSGQHAEYQYAVDLPTGTEKEFVVYYRPTPTQRAVRARLRTPRTTNWAEGALRLQDDGDLLFLVLGAPPGSFSTINALQFPPRQVARSPRRRGQAARAAVSWVALTDLPTFHAGYASVEVLVLVSPALDRLRADQAQAMQQWVTGGGTLVAFAGPNGAQLQVPGVADLLPATVERLRTLPDLSGLRPLLGASPPATPVVVSQLTPRAGARVLATQAGLPLLVWHRVGAGQVMLAAFDPSRRPLQAWASGQDALWQWVGGVATMAQSLTDLASTRPDQPGPAFRPSRRSVPDPTLPGALVTIPELEPPSYWLILFFLLAYLVVLVPLNYMVLRRLDRQELAWVTTPAIVAVFTLLTYGVGFTLRGGQVLVSVLTVIETGVEVSEAPARRLVGIFSPVAARYELAVEATPCALSEARFDQSDEAALPLVVGVAATRQWVKRARLNMWSLRAFEFETGVELGGAFRAVLDLRDNTLTGTIANRTRLDLERCRVRAGGRWHAVGDLPAGSSVRLPVTDQPQPTPPDAPDRLHKIRAAAQIALENAANTTTSPVLLGWTRAPLTPVRVNGRRVATEEITAVLVHLSLLAEPAATDIPARGWVVRTNGDAGLSGQYWSPQYPSGAPPSEEGVALSVGNGEVELAFACPVLTTSAVRRLAVRVSGMVPSQTLHILNRARGVWETPRPTRTEHAWTVYVLHPGAYLDPGSRAVRVRVKGSARGPSLVTMSVRYDTTR